MNKNIHALAGFTLGIQIAYQLQPALDLSPLQYTLCVAATTLGSLIPDIDTPYSYIGRKVKIISYPIYKIFGHRTITHSLLTWTLLLLFCPFFNTGLLYGLFCVSIYGGVISHLVLDLVSIKGVALLYPVCNIRFHLIPSFIGRVFSLNRYDENGSKYKNRHKKKYIRATNKNRRKKRLPI